MSLVTFENVCYKKVLFDMSFSLPHSGMIGLIGENGSGKSTVLHLIAGLIRPTGGRVCLNGQPIKREDREQVAFSPERDWLYPFLTVRQSLELASKLFVDFQIEKAKELIHRFHVDANNEIRHLSKGNRARLQAILTLSRTAPVLLLDEPLSGLDPVTREHLLELMTEHAELEKQSIIVSTHEVSEIELYLDHLLFIHQGKVIVSENADDLRATRSQSVLDVMREALL